MNIYLNNLWNDISECYRYNNIIGNTSYIDHVDVDSVLYPIEKGIDRTAFLEKIRQIDNLPKTFLLGVGTLSPRKNFTRFIQAFDQLAPEYPDTHLVIVGNKGWNFDDILEEGNREKVHLIGYVDAAELVALYNRYKIEY